MTEERKKSERRVFERFSARFPAKYKDTREPFGSNVFLRDASAQGAKISTTDRLYLNDSVSLEVDLPDGKNPLSMTGQVVWSKNAKTHMWDVGVKFHNISLMNMSRLYMHSLESA